MTFIWIIIITMAALLGITYGFVSIENFLAADITMGAVFLYGGIVFYLMGKQEIKDDQQK